MKLFIQIGKQITACENSEKTVKNMQNWAFFPQNRLFIHFYYEYRPFFIHSKIHPIVRQKIFIQRIYSFKK